MGALATITGRRSGCHAEKSWALPLLHQPITDSQFGQQNAWPGWIDLNLFAQFAHDNAQVMRVIEVRTTPNLLHDLLTREPPCRRAARESPAPNIPSDRGQGLRRRPSRSGWPN